MPTADRYARYREDQTTIWVSKTAAAFLTRERSAPSEGVAAVLDRLLSELRKLRRGTGEARGAAPRGGAPRGGAARGAATRGETTRKTARKATTRTARGTRGTAARRGS